MRHPRLYTNFLYPDYSLYITLAMDVNQIEKAITDSVNWLKYSGIMDVHSSQSGGVFAWYDPTTQSYPFYYSEITGYMISALVYIEKEISKDSCHLEMAAQASVWLRDKMFDSVDSSFRCRYGVDPNHYQPLDNHRLCTFDNGIIMNGLLSYYSRTQSQEVWDSICKVSNSLKRRIQLSKLIAKHRALPPNYRFEEESPGWSRQDGTFLIKAMAKLPQVERRKGNGDFGPFRRMLDRIVECQMDTGQIITDHFDQSTYFHPFCYTLEGMIMLWDCFPEEKYRDAIVKSMAWMLSFQNVKTGGFPHWVSKGHVVLGESSDINAQVLRLWSILIKKGWMEENREKFNYLVDRVLFFQDRNSSDSRAFGGFRYGCAKSGGEKDHINGWATIFCMQALHYAVKCYKQNAFIDVDGLI